MEAVCRGKGRGGGAVGEGPWGRGHGDRGRGGGAMGEGPWGRGHAEEMFYYEVLLMHYTQLPEGLSLLMRGYNM